jgi:hypothetical protein
MSSVPLIGSAVSVVMEAKLTEAANGKIEAALRQVSERVARLENDAVGPNDLAAIARSEHFPTEPLLQLLVHKAAQADDTFRPRLLANVLFAKAESGLQEIIRAHLIEVAATLTNFELAILMRVDQVSNARPPSNLSRKLREMDLNGAGLSGVRDFSYGRLGMFKLIQENSQKGHVVTPIGHNILDAIFE